MNLIQSSTPNKWQGGNTCKGILIHWWDNPAKRPTLNGVIAHFQNPAVEVSAHYVVSGDTVVQMCEETDRAWHALQANGFSIGIEVDPQTPGNTYKTVGELVHDIRSRRGNIPLEKHSDYVATDCPGKIDLGRIEKEANNEGTNMEDKVLTPKINRGDIDNICTFLFGRKANDGDYARVGDDWKTTAMAYFMGDEFVTKMQRLVKREADANELERSRDQDLQPMIERLKARVSELEAAQAAANATATNKLTDAVNGLTAALEAKK